MDDLVEGQAPQLHVQVDGPHHLAARECPGHGLVRRGPGQTGWLRRGREAVTRSLRDVPRDRRGVLQEDLVLEHAVEGVPRRSWRHLYGLLAVDPGLDGDQGL